MRVSGVSFSIAAQAAWAPGIPCQAQWEQWARTPWRITLADGGEPDVSPMPAMLRRRAGFLGRMALEVAYRCLDGRTDVPTIFCSRHGEAARAIGLLTELAQDQPLSPAGFGLAVHNASAGLLSIARADRANHIALAGGASTVEHAVIEACSLLADGAPMVLLVSYDHPLPPVLAPFEDCAEQPFAWAWLMVPAGADPIELGWSAHAPADEQLLERDTGMPGGLQVLRFVLNRQASMERESGRHRWHWRRNA